ncbi:MAG TPA: HD domain-containing phosphohydrolase, partial [Telluria sp.]|nr:HD domain-containing phosphohydrolase [Telluria sp.]
MAPNDPRTPDPELPDENPHYVRAVTEFGEQAEVLAAEDIYASNGMKLIAKGARIDLRQFEHLTHHKLAAPLDHSLCTEQPVDAAGLALAAGKFIEQHAVYRRIAMRAGDPLAVKHALANLTLPAPIQMRLSVMRARRTEMYEHSLRTAMVAFALAQRLHLPEREHGALLLACLCHDIGEMHTDPAILATGHSISPAERRFVHVHPITSYVLVHELPGFPPAAAQAILHHHERLDGSGYPNDLPGPRIPALARLVAVADVAEAVIKR